MREIRMTNGRQPWRKTCMAMASDAGACLLGDRGGGFA